MLFNQAQEHQEHIVKDRAKKRGVSPRFFSALTTMRFLWYNVHGEEGRQDALPWGPARIAFSKAIERKGGRKIIDFAGKTSNEYTNFRKEQMF